MYISVQHGLALTYVPYGKKKGLSLTFVALCTTRLSADIRYVPYCTTRLALTYRVYTLLYKRI
jgi:hypothetical protein